MIIQPMRQGFCRYHDDEAHGQSRGLVLGFLAMVWFLLTLPIRLILAVFSLLGRLTGIIVGFSLMVLGMALWAGPFFIIGIPLFIIGLVLTLRCLG